MFVESYVYMYLDNIPDGIGQNGMVRGIRKLEWHFSKSNFCNVISPTGENYNGIDTIN